MLYALQVDDYWVDGEVLRAMLRESLRGCHEKLFAASACSLLIHDAQIGAFVVAARGAEDALTLRVHDYESGGILRVALGFELEHHRLTVADDGGGCFGRLGRKNQTCVSRQTVLGTLGIAIDFGGLALVHHFGAWRKQQGVGQAIIVPTSTQAAHR